MPNEQLVNYIRVEKEKGYSEEQLRGYLLKQNYDGKMVEDAFVAARSSSAPKKAPVTPAEPASPQQPVQSTPAQPAVSSSQVPSETSQPVPVKNSAVTKRSIGKVILFSLITFGIYPLYWLSLTAKEIKDPQSDLNPNQIWLALIPVAGVVFAIIFLIKYGKDFEKVTGFSATGITLLFIFLGFIGMIIAQVKLNEVATA